MTTLRVFVLMIVAGLSSSDLAQTAPSGFAGALSPGIVHNINFVAIVSAPRHQTVGPITLYGRSTSLDTTGRTVDVTVVEGIGVAKGTPLHLISTARLRVIGEVNEILPKARSDRWLVAGWKAAPDGSVMGLPGETLDAPSGIVRPSEPTSGYACFLVPTHADKLLAGEDCPETVMLNFAACLEGAEQDVERLVSARLARFQGWRSETERIHGMQAFEWCAAKLTPLLERLQQTTKLDRLRIGGLLSALNPKKYSSGFLDDLPGLWDDLDLGAPDVFEHWNKASSLDNRFLAGLDLVTDADPAKIFALALSRNVFIGYALGPNTSAPSQQIQAKLLSQYSSLSPSRRCDLLTALARWNGEYEKYADLRIQRNGDFVILREEELHKYWINKLGMPESKP